MKIIYHCFGGSHSSVTAAAIHLKILPNTQVPSVAALKEIPYYDHQVGRDHGTIRLMGIDEFGNQVYVLGRRNSNVVTHNSLTGIAQIFGITPEELLLVDVMPYVNVFMMLGGFLSRKAGIVSIGRPIVLYGTQLAFFNIVGLVERIRLKASANKNRKQISTDEYYDY